MGRGSPYSEISIYLFIRLEDDIVNILDEYNIYSHSTYWVSEGNTENTEIKTTLVKSTDGFPDIIAFSDSTIENVMFDVEKDDITTRKNQGKNNEISKWKV